MIIRKLAALLRKTPAKMYAVTYDEGNGKTVTYIMDAAGVNGAVVHDYDDQIISIEEVEG